jgi:copper(I)-binding protein
MRKLALVSALMWMFAAAAAETARGHDIVIHDAWARASLGAAPNSAAYMVIETTGAAPDRLIGGATPVAAKVEPHAHVMEGGIAQMRPVDAIEIDPGTPTVLAPGGLHLMLIGLKEKLEDGATFPLTLTFERAGPVTVEVAVRGLAGSMGHGGHGGHGPPATN